MKTRPISHRSLVTIQHRTLGITKTIRRRKLRQHLPAWRVIRPPEASAPRDIPTKS